MVSVAESIAYLDRLREESERRAKERQAKQRLKAERDWQRVRYDAIRANHGKNGGVVRCEACGRSSSEVAMHVDHIKPKSKHPELRLDPNNLEILCADCNIGKLNRDTIDWRDKKGATHAE